MIYLIEQKTIGIISVWKNYSNTIAPDVYAELSKTSFEMIETMTSKLRYWTVKDLDIGDKILFYTCLGSIVEAWIRFFYCVCQNEYNKKAGDSRTIAELLNNTTFKKIINDSIGIIFESENDYLYKWAHEIRKLRNSIHIFKISSFDNHNYENDIKNLSIFIDRIWNELPPIEDVVIEKYADWDYC